MMWHIIIEADEKFIMSAYRNMLKKWIECENAFDPKVWSEIGVNRIWEFGVYCETKYAEVASRQSHNYNKPIFSWNHWCMSVRVRVLCHRMQTYNGRLIGSMRSC